VSNTPDFFIVNDKNTLDFFIVRIVIARKWRGSQVVIFTMFYEPEVVRLGTPCNNLGCNLCLNLEECA